jgi:hypothetical protein
MNAIETIQGIDIQKTLEELTFHGFSCVDIRHNVDPPRWWYETILLFMTTSLEVALGA